MILFCQAHDDWVLKVKHCPLLSDLAVVSCSRSSVKSIHVVDLGTFSPLLDLGIKQGVTCFDYCGDTHLVYTGCFDGRVSDFSISGHIPESKINDSMWSNLYDQFFNVVYLAAQFYRIHSMTNVNHSASYAKRYNITTVACHLTR